eukprot:1159088-Pelagomonas_calceolata.AAC.14
MHGEITAAVALYRRDAAAKWQHVSYEGAVLAAQESVGLNMRKAIAEHHAVQQVLKLDRRLEERIACFISGRCVSGIF